jgi:hypothetical protein
MPPVTMKIRASATDLETAGPTTSQVRGQLFALSTSGRHILYV